MRVTYNNRTASFASEAVRLRLQRTSFQSAGSTTRIPNSILPRQVVSAKGGHVHVTKEDGSIVIAVLHNGSGETFNYRKNLQGNDQAIVGNLCNVLI